MEEQQHYYANSPFTCLQCCCCAVLEALGRRLSQDLFVRKGWLLFNLVQGRRVPACLPSYPLHISLLLTAEPLERLPGLRQPAQVQELIAHSPARGVHTGPQQLLSCGCLGWHWVLCGHHKQCGQGSEPRQDWLGLPQSAVRSVRLTLASRCSSSLP